MRYYTDKQTADFLARQNNIVYMLGGYDDPNNFGDIIQLKAAMEFHRQQGVRTPVILLSYRAFKSEDYVTHLKKWFNCDYFVFQTHDEQPEQNWTSISPLEHYPSGGLLHVYGGGYLNKMWGEWHLKEIEVMLDLFKIDNYLLSGHQIDQEIVPRLKVVFEKKMPLLVGLRDHQSLEYVRGMDLDVPAHYSFDDVTRIFMAWISTTKQDVKSIIASTFRKQKYAIHMNMASYAGDDEHRENIIHAIRGVDSLRKGYGPIVLHSFNERRLNFTKDSLGSIIELQEEFPYHAYSVVNLAQMALDINPANNYYPDISGVISSVDFAITCSYHTSMLMSFLGKPTYLIASNEYYRQKRLGLGYTDDLDAYLNNPSGHIRDFSDEIAQHEEWLKLVEEVVK